MVEHLAKLFVEAAVITSGVMSGIAVTIAFSIRITSLFRKIL